jgi:hypothetical protein
MTDELDGYDDFGARGWGHPDAGETEHIRQRHLANPGDAPGYITPGDRASSLRGPDFAGAPGYVAIVQGQVYLVAALLIAQLFLITVGLFELLSGRTAILWWIAGASLVAFLLTLLITLWPRRRIAGGS